LDDSTITLKCLRAQRPAETVGLAFHGNQWPLGFERFGFYAPKHYLEQFHPAYNADATYEMFEEKAFDYNVERPVMTAWKITQYDPGATLMVRSATRTYWAVDVEGKQLPLIDRSTSTWWKMWRASHDGHCRATWTCRRAPSPGAIPVYMENAEANNYHMLLWPQAMASNATFFINQSYPDPKYRELFRTSTSAARCRSPSIRNAVPELVFLGQACRAPRRVVPTSTLSPADIEMLNAEIRPGHGGNLAPMVWGLVKGSDGVPHLPDGSELLIVIQTAGTGRR